MTETNDCGYCSHALYAGAKCKNCGCVTEHPAQQRGLEMVDDEGENRAVRMFLALYGGQHGVTAEQMRKHLKMAGFDGAWPEWANTHNGHLTKAGAQLWIRHLFALEQPAQPQQEPVAWRELCRRLYVELFHCDWQMTAAWDEEGGPMWQQGATVRDVLADAKAALETSPPAQRTWVGLSDGEIEEILADHIDDPYGVAYTVNYKLKEKNNGN